MDIENLTISKFREGLKNKEFSVSEVVGEYLGRIGEKNPEWNVYLDVYKDSAREEAERIDQRREKGEELPPLAGLPLAVKDNILISGKRATAGSRILENYTAAYDATVIEKLKDQHVVVLGKANLDEFAMGGSTENSAFGPVRNPHDPERVPGGSSGGSAAAVAGGLALAALGSDTGGSIRQPAAFCGVAGLRPTYGAVSRFGLIALGSSLDQIGPLGRSVRDVGELFDVIQGGDSLDATASGTDRPVPDKLDPRVKDLVIGVPKEYFEGGLEESVQEGMDEAMERLKSLDFRFKEISLPHTKHAVSCYYIILPAEASTNLARFDGIRYGRDLARDAENLRDLYVTERGEGFGDEPLRRILLGTFVLSSGYYDAYYAKAQKVRRLIRDDFKRAFEDVDVIFSPTTPTQAFKLGEKVSDPLSMYLSDIFTVPVNLAGLPGLSVPVKKYPLGEGLPVGFQLIGKHFRENDILGIGRYYEEA